jgi:hypothetical protein
MIDEDRAFTIGVIALGILSSAIVIWVIFSISPAIARGTEAPRHPHLRRDVPTKIADRSRFDRRPSMKAFGAALIAAAILYI